MCRYSSSSIWPVSQGDNSTSLEIAKSTKSLAEESRRDSSSMITIADLTMVFLPGTFISVSAYAMKMCRGFRDASRARPLTLIHNSVYLQYRLLQSLHRSVRYYASGSCTLPLGLLRLYHSPNCRRIPGVERLATNSRPTTAIFCSTLVSCNFLSTKPWTDPAVEAKTVSSGYPRRTYVVKDMADCTLPWWSSLVYTRWLHCFMLSQTTLTIIFDAQALCTNTLGCRTCGPEQSS